MSEKSRKDRKHWKYLKAPIKILAKASDFYMKSMKECSNQVLSASSLGCPSVHVDRTTRPLPRSHSVGSTKSSPAELNRAASTRSLGNYGIEANGFIEKQQQGRQKRSPKSPYNVRRSQSVGFSRFDEDVPCEFGEDSSEVYANVFPRSRSYAVGKRKITFF